MATEKRFYHPPGGDLEEVPARLPGRPVGRCVQQPIRRYLAALVTIDAARLPGKLTGVAGAGGGEAISDRSHVLT